MRGQTAYKVYEDYFIDIEIYSTGVNNNIIKFIGNIKPMFFDDIFWEMLKMPDNSNEPLSLRSYGAFKVWPLQIYSYRQNISEYDEVDDYVESFFEECDKAINETVSRLSTIDDYLSYSKTLEKTIMYDHVLADMLIYLHQEDYSSTRELAKKEINNGNEGNFYNKGKYIYSHILDYCNDKIKEG